MGESQNFSHLCHISFQPQGHFLLQRMKLRPPREPQTGHDGAGSRPSPPNHQVLSPATTRGGWWPCAHHLSLSRYRLPWWGRSPASARHHLRWDQTPAPGNSPNEGPTPHFYHEGPRKLCP